MSAVTALLIGVRHESAGCLVLAPEALSSEGGAVKVVASPSTGVNTLTGEGLAEVLEGDPREVLTDEETRCSGARITERTLLPGPDARLGEITLGTWLAQQ